jgi:hypothetical protein
MSCLLINVPAGYARQGVGSPLSTHGICYCHAQIEGRDRHRDPAATVFRYSSGIT